MKIGKRLSGSGQCGSLISAAVRDGTSGVTHPSRWLANRSFVGQDRAGRIIIGTTTDAFFSLDRLAQFLIAAPLDLTTALNLDGGPVACQGIALNGYERRTVGRYELEVEGPHAQLLTMSYGIPAMPVVLAVFPKNITNTSYRQG